MDYRMGMAVDVNQLVADVCTVYCLSSQTSCYSISNKSVTKFFIPIFRGELS